jgi:hypothetical protein
MTISKKCNLDIFALDTLNELSNDKLDLIYLFCFKVLEKIGLGKNLNYFEKKASNIIERINNIKAKRLFD